MSIVNNNNHHHHHHHYHHHHAKCLASTIITAHQEKNGAISQIQLLSHCELSKSSTTTNNHNCSPREEWGSPVWVSGRPRESILCPAKSRLKVEINVKVRIENQSNAKLDQVYCAWLIKWVVKREIIQLDELCITRWWMISGTWWYWVSIWPYWLVLDKYMLVLLGIKWHRVSKGLVCLYILEKVEIWSGDTDAWHTYRQQNIELLSLSTV